MNLRESIKFSIIYLSASNDINNVTDVLVSVKFISSFDTVLFRFLLDRPVFWSLDSKSSVGESQNLGGAQSCLVQSMSVPTYVFPLHVTFTANTPPSVSCHTIPSRVTDVPGSHGPKQSGSVIVPIDVPTQTSIIFFGSHFMRFVGGEDDSFKLGPSSLLVLSISALSFGSLFVTTFFISFCFIT
jgi:hypothetical protein